MRNLPFRTVLAGLALLALGPGRGWSQQTAPAAPPPPETAVREYQATAEELRAALLAVLEAEEMVLESDPEAPDDALVTAYRAFDREDFGPDVATPPPAVSRTYPFFQPEKLGLGKFRLRSRIEPIENGQRLTLTAEILADAFNRMTYEHTELKRISNGMIEGYFHDRIEARLSQLSGAGD
ncbi:MAG: hypothetical protein PVF68_06545 [Acidobacteriota bacterium]|jgi:hypothetical protein